MLTHPAESHVLGDMLTYMRPDGCKAEIEFIQQYILPLDVKQDDFGNLYKIIDDPTILWSCHTDTVHAKGGRQSVKIDNGIARSWDNCLGADCTTGVFIMRQMILNNVPGLYIFHRAEEVGCKGSRFIVSKTPELLKNSKFAIAFDRKAYTSIITHQSSSRCCSDAFADSLSLALDPSYVKDTYGSYTDTAQYVDLIGECTNLSVGYFAQHTKSETQDVDFACALADRLCVADFSKLVEKRKAGEADDDWQGYSGYGRYYSNAYRPKTYNTPEEQRKKIAEAFSLYTIIADYPYLTSQFMEDYGFTKEEFKDWHERRVSRVSQVAAITHQPNDEQKEVTK